MAIQINRKKETAKDEQGPFDFMNKEITLFGAKFNDKRKEEFYNSLHVLLNAGVQIAQVLETLIEESTNPIITNIFVQVYEGLVSGLSLSNAVKATDQFSDYEYYSLKIGEESGRLVPVVSELQKFFHDKIIQKRKIIGALTYPIVVLSVAFFVVSFMLQVIVPMFADVFNRFGGDLPWITKQVTMVSVFFGTYFWWLLIVFGILVLLFLFFRKKEGFQRNMDAILLKLPIIGELVKGIYLSRLCNSLTLLLGAKVPMNEALAMIEKMISFHPLKQAAVELNQSIMKGHSLHKSFADQKLFPNRVASFVKIGEEVNQLETMFDKLSKQYENETNHNIQVFNSILEPVLIIVLAIIIGVILVAMYLPIFKLSTEMI